MATLHRSLLIVLLAALPATALAQKPLAKENPVPAVRAAGSDVGKLLQLAKDWAERKHVEGARTAWKRVLELDPDQAEARAGLGHQRYAGKWFESHTALFDHKRAEDAQQAKLGLARVADGWVPIADAPFVRLGWAKDEQGAWQHPLARLRAEKDRAMQGKGCQQQDLEWIDPAEFEQWKQGLWKCGEKWLDTAAANAFHADMNQPWYVASEHFVVTTTVDRERVEWCKWYADQTWPELVRLFGIAPGARPSAIDLMGPKNDKPEIVVWNSLAQFNKFAAGAENEGFSSLHYAFFADALFDPTVKPAAFAAIGAAYWDASTPQSGAFGQHAIRHAAALSFVEAIDPSWRALGDVAMGTQAKSTAAFWAEKRIPRWLRHGAASYVERWFHDKNVGEGGDPEWARKWARASLKKDGGLRDLAKVFEFKLAIADVPGSTRLLHEAGLVTAFVLDGGDMNVQRAHEALKQALVSGASTTAAVADLQKALLAAKGAIAAFAAR
ncbi:MAG: hypothetical protein JNK15_21975 [Planctomycetes bacterium]|nr:hypothetical protein [Planctomycetota bacterium]